MSKRILIIDDEVMVSKMLVYRLKAKGYDVVTAQNGLEGLKAADEFKPDLIILDYRLPDLDACEVSEKIKEKISKDIPIILTTASIENILEKSKECGGIDYITKPIDHVELYEKVEKYI